MLHGSELRFFRRVGCPLGRRFAEHAALQIKDRIIGQLADRCLVAGGILATRAAGMNRATALIVTIARCDRRGAAGAPMHRGDPT
jgi:hypothetical protein